MDNPLYYVYFLSNQSGNFIYVGYSSNVHRRVKQHNAGKVISTKFHRPLTLKGYLAVETKKRALKLEHYFKGGSGKAFLRKRII
ncbi:MAG: GIY-YIG nuclease family protein [Cytophagales bacterium]